MIWLGCCPANLFGWLCICERGCVCVGAFVCVVVSLCFVVCACVCGSPVACMAACLYVFA